MSFKIYTKTLGIDREIQYIAFFVKCERKSWEVPLIICYTNFINHQAVWLFAYFENVSIIFVEIVKIENKNIIVR